MIILDDLIIRENTDAVNEFPEPDPPRAPLILTCKLCEGGCAAVYKQSERTPTEEIVKNKNSHRIYSNKKN